MKLTYIALTLYAACYALLFGTWAAIVFYHVPNADEIVRYIQMGLVAITSHVLTILNPASLRGPNERGGQDAPP